LASDNPKFNLPAHLVDRVATFGESSYGATLITLVLKHGTRTPHVHVAWGLHVIKATGSEEDSLLANLDPSEVADALPES
jgi:hypothetical protein